MKSQGETNHWVYWSIHCIRTSIQINYCHSHSIENVTLQNNLDPGESYLILKGIINNLEGTVEGGRSNRIAVLSPGIKPNCSSKRTHLCKIKTWKSICFFLICWQLKIWNQLLLRQLMINKIMYKFQLNSNKQFKSSEDYNITKLSMK